MLWLLAMWPLTISLPASDLTASLQNGRDAIDLVAVRMRTTAPSLIAISDELPVRVMNISKSVALEFSNAAAQDMEGYQVAAEIRNLGYSGLLLGIPLCN
jgi:hypothetical protein